MDHVNVPRNGKPYCSTVLHFPVETGRYISTQMLADMILSLSWQKVGAGVLSRELRKVGKDSVTLGIIHMRPRRPLPPDLYTD